MQYQIKLKPDQLESIEYVLKKYLSEQKVEQAMQDIKMSYWPDEMDDDSGEPESMFESEPSQSPVADRF